MIKGMDCSKVNLYKTDKYINNSAQSHTERRAKGDEFVHNTKTEYHTKSSLINRIKSAIAAFAIGLSAQSCSEESPIDDIEKNPQGQVMDFGQALEHLRENSYTMTPQKKKKKLDSTVYANTDKIDDYANRSKQNYETTSEFVKTVLSAFGTESSEFNNLDEDFNDISKANDGLLNADYVRRIQDLYKEIDNIKLENPAYYEKHGYLTDVSNKQKDLKINCTAANSVRGSALRRLKNAAETFDRREPVITGDEYETGYEKYMNQIGELSLMKSLNTKEADGKIGELINTFNELNKIADKNGKERINDAGIKMLDASHTMVDAACRVLIESMETATSDAAPDFSESFELIHENLDKIQNTNDYDSPVVDEIIDGLNL